MNLSQINSVCRVTPQKPVRRLQELSLEVPEEILSAKCVSGKFAPQILLELNESIVFLPQRVMDTIAPYMDALKGYCNFFTKHASSTTTITTSKRTLNFWNLWKV
ncbi:hypothetical protein ABEB36_009418 [Hypothenemus hampei]|uniref:Uncharacterized protein n=1 Tax=Hypothenemus hampei TaxID=57062 RepID=A0ABD1EG99_HYPHA